MKITENDASRLYSSILIFLVSAAYFIYEYIFVSVWSMHRDEFFFAHHIYQFTLRVPYRDFAPYKSVLGYYLLSIPYYLFGGLYEPVLAIKREIIFLNSVFMLIGSFMAMRIYAARAVLVSLVLVICNLLFIEYSSELRTDMLAVWFSLLAVLLVVMKRGVLSGVLASLGFLISQKIIIYFAAINVGLIVCLLFLMPVKRLLRTLFEFNISFIALLTVYICFWAYLSSFSVVLNSLFHEAYVLSQATYMDNWFDAVIWFYLDILRNGPILFVLFPLTLLALFKSSGSSHDEFERKSALIVSFFAFLFLLLNKQPFGYSFVVMFPVFFIAYAAFFTWAISFFFTVEAQREVSKSGLLLPVLLCGYALILFYYLGANDFSNIYLLIPVIPLFLSIMLAIPRLPPVITYTLRSVMLIVLILSGFLYPLYQSVRGNLEKQNNYQRVMVELADKMMGHDDYVAGIPFFYYRNQPVAGLRNMAPPQIAFNFQPSEYYSSLLFPSFYQSPVTAEEVFEQFQKAPVKVVIFTRDLEYGPSGLNDFILKNYKRFYGCLYVYAPIVFSYQHKIEIKFDGKYLVEITDALHSVSTSTIKIDGVVYRSGQIVTLKQGEHEVDADGSYRLVFQPDIDPVLLKPEYDYEDREKVSPF